MTARQNGEPISGSRTTKTPSATTTVPTSTHTHSGGTFTGTGLVLSGHERITNPAAPQTTAGGCTLVTDVGITDVVLTLAAQPVVPVKLNVVITDADDSVSAGTLTLVGIGARGQAVTQAIPLKAAAGPNSRTVVTTDAYASITSATITASAGVAAGDNVAIGMSAAIGLAVPQVATAIGVFRASVDDVREAVGTVDATAGTIIPTTAPNGTRDFDFWWNATVTPAGSVGTSGAPSATTTVGSATHLHAQE